MTTNDIKWEICSLSSNYISNYELLELLIIVNDTVYHKQKPERQVKMNRKLPVTGFSDDYPAGALINPFLHEYIKIWY